MNRLYLYLLLSFMFVSISCQTKNKVVTQSSGNLLMENVEVDYLGSLMDGKKFELVGDYSNALIAYERAISLMPDKAEAYYCAAKLLYEYNDNIAPTLYATKASEIDPKNKWYRILQISVSQKYSDLAVVKKLLSKYSIDFPNDVDNIYDFGLYMFQNSEYLLSLEYLNKVKDKIGYTDDIISLSIQNYIKLNQYTKVFELINEVQLLYPDDLKYKGLLAEFYSTQKQFAKADSIYSDILKRDMGNGFVYLSMANFYLMQNDVDNELKYFKLALDDPHVPASKKLEYMMFVSKQFLNNDSLMLDLLSGLELTAPDDPMINSSLARIHMKSQNYSLARLYLRKALNVNNSDYNQWVDLLNVDTQLGLFAELEKDATDAIDLFPNQPLLYLYLGVAKIHFEKFVEAESYLEIGKSLSFDDQQLQVEFNIQLADVFYRLRKFQKSDLAYKYVLERDPNNFAVMNNYAYNLALRGTDLPYALQLIDKALVLSPGHLNYIDTKAWILYKMGNYADALAVMEGNFDFVRMTNTVILEHYGDILYKNGRTNQAREIWKRCIDLGRDNEIIRSKVLNGLN